jgi:hypothetical protein
VIPRVAFSIRLTAVVRDDHGDYWGADRSARFGRLDMKNQTLEAPIQTDGWFPSMVRVGGAYLAIERGSPRFGRFDPTTGAFTAIGTAAIPCCGSYGLAAGGALYLAARQAGSVILAKIDPTTGALGPPVTIAAPPGFQIEDMRFFDGTLYATTRSGTLVTIDPVTGATTVLPLGLGRFSAMEVFE